MKGKGDIMTNQMFLLGRLVDKPEVKELESGKKVTNLTLAVQRSYKNQDGEYETDFVDCALWNHVAEATSEYCKKGDLVAVRGRLETNTYEREDGTKAKSYQVVADKISFLASSKDRSIKEEPEMAVA